MEFQISVGCVPFAVNVVQNDLRLVIVFIGGHRRPSIIVGSFDVAV